MSAGRFVDEAVVNFSCDIIPGRIGPDDLSEKGLGKFGHAFHVASLRLFP